MPTVRANNIDIYYEESGPADAPVILLVMGLGTQMIAWPEDMIQGLVAQGFRVIHYDNRDVGLSQRMDGAPAPNLIWTMVKARVGLPTCAAYTLTDMMQDGIALLDALGIAKAHIAGASMGGMIVRAGLPGPRADIRKRLMAPRPSNPTREQAVRLGAESLETISYADKKRPNSAFEDMAARAFDRSYYPIGMKRQLLAIIADGSRVSRLKTVKVPTLVVHGGADPLVPKEGSEDIARLVANARLEIIPEMAHDLPPSQVGRMVDLIAGHAKAQ